MSANKKDWTALAIIAIAFASFSARAAVLTFGGTMAYQQDVDSSSPSLIAAGLTSAVPGYINAATNTVTGTNVFLETFDAPFDPNKTTINQVNAATRPTVGPNVSAIEYGGPNGGFNTLNPNDPANGGDLTITDAMGQGMGIRKGTTTYAAAPGSDCSTPPCDATYFAYGPGQNGGLPSAINVNYAGLLAAYNPGSRIDYLGMYLGSVDTYNSLEFFDQNGHLINGSGALSDGILTGTEILQAMGCTDVNACTGNQSGPNSNVYLNIFFTPQDDFSSFSFVTTGVAFEIDNVVTHLDAVPEPASLLLFGLGLLGLAGIRRKARF